MTSESVPVLSTGIDVQRLAQAMWNREKAFLPISMVHPWESLPDAERALVIAEAAPLAAEYDRLTSEAHRG